MKLVDFAKLVRLIPEETRVVNDDSRLVSPDNFLLVHQKNLSFIKNDIDKIDAKRNIIICQQSFVPSIPGVRCIVETEADFAKEGVLKVISIDDKEFEIGAILRAFYEHYVDNIGVVTGTNGKTSTTSFVRQLISNMDSQNDLCVSIENTEVILGSGTNLNLGHNLTTPSACDAHKIFHITKKHYCANYGVFEASSHGLHQNRVAGLCIKVAGSTQLTMDHLDYHKDMKSYFEAKKLLFSKYLSSDGVAVLNADIDEFEQLKQVANERGIKVISYGKNGTDIKLLEETWYHSGYRLRLLINNTEFVVDTSFCGSFQNYNIMCAIGILMGFGFDPHRFVHLVPHLVEPEGRMENVPMPAGNKSNIYVDYAHTPDALEIVIKGAKSICNGRVIIVFGCGGDRDKAKRSVMGNIVATLADVGIVTDDNPRTENPQEIRSQILSGVNAELKEKMHEIGNRGEAIKAAIEMSAPEDVVILAGKGQEKTQTIGNQKLLFSDYSTAKEVLHNIFHIDKLKN